MFSNFPPRRREVPITDYNPTMLSLDQARQMILAAIEPLPEETISLQDSLGRVAAANIIATEDLVPFARSAMDGFAVRAADTAGATAEQPVGLPIRGNAFAEAGTAQLIPGAAIAISTGAPMPAGADAVIPIERRRTLLPRHSRPRSGFRGRIRFSTRRGRTQRRAAAPSRRNRTRRDDCAPGFCRPRAGQRSKAASRQHFGKRQ